MRILHTSDVHLSEHRSETISALDEILRVAVENSVDVLTISGDVFDSHEDAEALRPQLRQKFSSDNLKIFAIPGNHDAEVYRSNLDFGSNFKVAVREPYEVFALDNTAIVALPFTPTLNEKLLSQLQKEAERDEAKVLLIHCTLDIGFSAGDFGEGEFYRYCPISKATLSRLGFDFVLAGHFHRITTILNLGDKGRFVYPGSPVSHSAKEIGKRQAILIDTEQKECRAIPLQSFYYDIYHITATPGSEGRVVENIRRWISERRNDCCSLKVIVDGFIERDEPSFRMAVEEVAKEANVDHLYRNVKEVLEHPLFIRFKKKLDKRNFGQKKNEIEEKVIEAMIRLLRSRELRA
ncbi:MAG: metallophosphoesterase family protein [Fervidobacterium sp.]